MATGSLPSFTVLTEEDDVPGSKFEREPEEYTVGQLKRWLKCRGLKLSGKRDELLKRVSDCIKSGNHHTLDPSIDDGKWFSAKVLKENAKLQANCSLSSLPGLFHPLAGVLSHRKTYLRFSTMGTCITTHWNRCKILRANVAKA